MSKKLKIAIALGIVYLLGLFTFSIITYPRTTVHGASRGFMRKEEALNSEGSSSIEIVNERSAKTATLTSANIDYTQRIKPGEKIRQNAFIWPIGIFMAYDYEPEYEISYSRQKLEDFVASSEIDGNRPPEDARLEFVNGKYEIIPEIEGDMLNKELAVEKVLNGFLTGEDELVLEDVYLEPVARAEDPNFIAKVEELNKLAAISISFDVGDDIIKIDGEDILDLYAYDGEDFIPIRDQVYEFVRQLAIEYDTYGEDTVRPFTTTNGDKIEVVGGIYGWLMDVDATTDLAMEALQKREATTIIPEYIEEGLVRGKDDLGDTYIELSLDNQYLWFYKDGELVAETAVVTGDPSRGVATPTGVDKIWSKERDRSLVGIVPEGTSDYSAKVDYWMPINWSDVGIHNSTWRTDYGGSIYQGSGSYGCVNLPTTAAGEIFENVELNTPVVIY